MAAVTQGGQPQRHVIGDLVMRVFTVSGASGSTLDTGMINILAVLVQPGSTVTGFTKSGGTLTLTTGGGAMDNDVVVVIARVG